MANIGVRSPYFVNFIDPLGTAVSSKVEVTINSVLRYTIIKNTGDSVRIDISELARDYVAPVFTGAFAVTVDGRFPGTAIISLSVSFWDTINATGTQVGDTQTPASDTAYDGYRYFNQGNNFILPTGPLLSGTSIYAPENTTGSFYVMGAGGTLAIETYGSLVTSAAGITIKRQECSKYTPIKCVFINKFGVHQEFYFFTKKTDSFSMTGDSYISNIVAGDGTYDVRRHQIVDFNKNGKINYSLNTGFISEADNAYIQELMLSEQVWLVISGSVVPVRPLTTSVQYRTSLNDKMVSYTVELEQSNNVISTVR
jgi:hypothetical protein